MAEIHPANWPVPAGPGNTFAALPIGARSPKFDLPKANYLITFQPRERNDPGTLILYDSTNTALVTLSAGGYATFTPGVGGLTGYYFTASNGAKIAAITAPYRGT